MWAKAEDVPKDAADSILARWDQTPADLQRMIVLQNFIDVGKLQADRNELLKALRIAWGIRMIDPEAFRAAHAKPSADELWVLVATEHVGDVIKKYT